MTLLPIDRTIEQAHLSARPAGSLLTIWHNTEDVQAFWTDANKTREMLMVRGHIVNLSPRLLHPSQLVINFCALSTQQERETWIADWLAL